MSPGVASCNNSNNNNNNSNNNSNNNINNSNICELQKTVFLHTVRILRKVLEA